MLALCLPVFSQEYRHKEVRTKIFLDDHGGNAITTVTYSDGLGRPCINVTTGLSAGEYTAFTLSEEDAVGLHRKEWQTAVIDGNKPYWLSPDDIKRLSKGTNGDMHSYTETECDMLGHVQSVSGPGEYWKSNGKKVTIRRVINTDEKDPKYAVKRYSALNTSKVEENGYWPAGSLKGEEHIDEDGHVTIVFTDIFSQKVLERRQKDSDDYLDTYFVYNGSGQLRFVLTPMYAHENNIGKYAYEYRYDAYGRCKGKHVPGCGVELYWYDADGHMVFSQDAVLNEASRYRFTYYDDLGRKVLQGTCSQKPSKTEDIAFRVTRMKENSICGTGYTASYIPPDAKLEYAYYYDNYDFLILDSFSIHQELALQNPSLLKRAPGMKTGWTLATTDGGRIYGVCRYTDRGWPAETTESMPGDRTLTTLTSYSFTGKPLKTLYELRHNGEVDSATVKYVYSTHNDDLVEEYVSCNGSSFHQVLALKSDALGRQAHRFLPGKAGCVDYTYNVRGWMTQAKHNVYTERISYDGLFNGNITATENLYSGILPNIHYNYHYDQLGRLKEAVSPGEFNYGESTEYDDNGNIIALNRYGFTNTGRYGLVDQLQYTRFGNRIHSVEDKAGSLVYDGSFDFKPSGSGGTYEYNPNGSLTRDPDKGITISYAETGTPRRMVFDAGGETRYNYDAEGRKLKVTWSTDTSGSSRSSDGNKIVRTPGPIVKNCEEYIGPFVLKEGSLDCFLFDGGFCLTREDAYFYYLRDHLGSVRAVIYEGGDVVQTNGYYPLGGVYASKNAGFQDYKFSGKEFDHRYGLNLYDFGTRMYDPALGEWISVDPLNEDDPSTSPYAYCKGDPINRLDPNGMDDYFDNNGIFIKHTNDNDNILIASGNSFLNIKNIDFNKRYETLSNIGNYYLSQLDQNIKLKIEHTGGDNPISAGMANIKGTENYIFIIGQDGKVNGEYGIASNLINSFYHETTYRYNNITLDGPIGEVNAVLLQTQHPSWNKVSESFAYSQASYAASQLNKAMEDKSYDKSIDFYIKSLNNAFAGLCTFSVVNNKVIVSNLLKEIVIYGTK